ncbi:uncharacterized protein LOC9654282 [Selaginella moellendorffii]|uniref:uncharacterized protein LOC9654282 n=1 Tax=Selaginella moellendorffii TaxID=88036 RepID=UPI000D1C21AD|nr:uncharacterized protein LOC9654282 [Selaginella moellendorffii]|eukprot:XP_002964348.2 uncharacterized protein LOC9654282 [Selaginella moellendorffii]
MECLLRPRTRIGISARSHPKWVARKEFLGSNPIKQWSSSSCSPAADAIREKRAVSTTVCAVREPEYVEDKKLERSSGIQSIEGAKWDPDALFLKDSSEPLWEQLSLTFRVVYGLGLYAGLAFVGQAICKVIGIDCWGGFEISPEAVLDGLGYAVVPMLALLFIQDDAIVNAWAPARAVRDVEDGELMEYFEGMGWQFLPIVIAGALSEEIFFRVALQGGFSHAIQASASLNQTPQGLSALTAIVPCFAPFAQILAVVLSSALTGSMYYVITAPKDPTYVIAPVSRGKQALKDMRKRFEVWNERRTMKKIYSPLMESLLALYLGFEWLQTGNILAPMVTHLVYSNVVVGNGLLRLHYQRVKLRQRVASIMGYRKDL